MPHAFKLVRYADVETHFRLGWMVAIPNGPTHHQYYGIALKWICPCPMPGER